MKLTVLGSGTGTLHPKRGSAGYWLEAEGGLLMLDCSASAIWRLAEYGLDWPNLDTIWISHFHLDHVGGLAPFLAGTRHADAMEDRTKPLRIFGPQGLNSLLQSFNSAYDYKLFKQPFPVEVVEVDKSGEFEVLPRLPAVTHKTPHTPESLAIRLQEGDRSLVYTADTGFTEDLGSFAKNVDLLVTECSYLRDKPVQKHLELREAIHIIGLAQPKQSVLTHFYPFWDDIDFETEVKRIDSSATIKMAFDGLQLDV